MLTILKRSAKRLFLVALASVCLAVGTVPTHANTVTIINVLPDGSFAALSCGSSAGNYVVFYDATLKQYFFFDATAAACTASQWFE